MASAQRPQDTFSRFLQGCENSQEYPSTLQNPSLTQDVRDKYHQLLEQHSSNLFDKKRSRITLWEFWNDFQEFAPATKVDTESELWVHFQQPRESSLKCRYIFIKSASSRDPLDCSEDLLKKLLTFHQVDPFFLDDLLTFGKQRDSLDAGLSQFTDHNAYYMDHRLQPLPLLGRSGHEIRHSFLLRSAERAAPGGDDPWPWPIRPCATYHSFDLVTGKSVWITVKGDDLIQNRIMNNAPTFPAFSPTRDPAAGHVDTLRCFEATLATHLIYFHWCERSWRWFIRDIDNYINEKLAKARVFPVDRSPYRMKFPERSSTGLSSVAKRNFAQNRRQQSRGQFLRSFLRRARLLGNSPIADVEATPEGATYRDETHDEAEESVLSQITFRDLQTLNAIHRRLEEGKRVCELNRQVLRNVCEYYNRISQYYPDDISSEIEEAIGKSIWRFIPKVESIIEGFKCSETRLTSLRAVLVETDKSLIENILQLRVAHVSRVFAEAAHTISNVMCDIADRTANISHSAYIIGFIAFFLLCATFTISLLQSPIYQCNQDEQRVGQCSFYSPIFLLFIEISVPMTVVVLGFFWGLKVQSRKTR